MKQGSDHTQAVEKDMVKRHENSVPHLEARRQQAQKQIGAEAYSDVIYETPNVKSFKGDVC